jgi:hypothetical protein
MSDHGDKELLGAKDLEAMTGTKASTWRYWAYRQAQGLEEIDRTGVA